MARDKLATANFLAQAGLPSPRTISLEEFVGGRAELTLPLLAKPGMAVPARHHDGA